MSWEVVLNIGKSVDFTGKTMSKILLPGSELPELRILKFPLYLYLPPSSLAE